MNCICRNGARVTCPVHGSDVSRMLSETEARHRSAGYADGSAPSDDKTAADKLRELLATRPAMPNTEELVRWWRSSAELIPQVLGELADRQLMVMQATVGLEVAAKALEAIAAERDVLKQEVRELEQQRDAHRAVLNRIADSLRVVHEDDKIERAVEAVRAERDKYMHELALRNGMPPSGRWA